MIAGSFRCGTVVLFSEENKDGKTLATVNLGNLKCIIRTHGRNI